MYKSEKNNEKIREALKGKKCSSNFMKCYMNSQSDLSIKVVA